MLEMFLFLFVPAGLLFAVFYFTIQLIAKYIWKEKIDMNLKRKNFFLNFVSLSICYLIICSIDVAQIILEWIRRIICNITSIEFCNYNTTFFNFPDEKILYLVFLVRLFIIAFCIYLLYKIYLHKRKINWEKAKRKYYYLWTIIILSLIPMLMYISIFPFWKKTIEDVKQLSDEEIIIYFDETRIFNDEVEKLMGAFNYCETDEDCKVFNWPAPFDCNIVLNKEKAELSMTIMNNMIKKYQWNHPEFCDDYLPAATCENKKCIITQDNDVFEY